MYCIIEYNKIIVYLLMHLVLKRQHNYLASNTIQHHAHPQSLLSQIAAHPKQLTATHNPPATAKHTVCVTPQSA